MPADINTMAYVGQTPWHGLGTRAEQAMTWAEAKTLGQLDWEVGMHNMYVLNRYGEYREVPGKKAVVREDNNVILGVVGANYQPYQNDECFAFLDEVAGRGFRYHTVGALGSGERVWLLGKLDGSLGILGTADISEKYLLLSTSHDGSSTLQVFFTTVRVVCSNTLAMAKKGRGKGEGINIKHTKNLKERVDEARQILGLAKVYYDDLQDNMNKLARIQVDEQARKFYYSWLYPNRDSKGEVPTKTANIHAELERLFHESPGNAETGIRGSAWALVNSVTDFVDHYRSTRGTNDTVRAENRFESALWGSGNALKVKAFEGALTLLN